MKTLADNNIVRNFEARVFHYGMIVGMSFRLLRTIHELLIDSPTPIILLGVFNLFLLIFLFWLYRKNFTLAFVIFFTQVLISSIITWSNSGGWNGTIPYLFLVLMITMIITSYGLLQIGSLLVYGTVLILFAYTDFAGSMSSLNKHYSLLSMEFDFLINTTILILITFYLKENFISFRESVEQNNEQLRRSSETLIEQTRQLYTQQRELNEIRNKLEATIPEKITEVQNRADVLNEYAFINAHHVRGPLARILGLIYLIELENKGKESPEAFHKIKRSAEDMDAILGKINRIIT